MNMQVQETQSTDIQGNASNAMLVELRISTWTARKQDKRVSKAVSQANQMTDDAGSYYKSLVKSPELSEVNRLVSAARAEHYLWTLPWLDSGPRVLPASAFFDYTQAMADYRNQYDAAVTAFLAIYPEAKESARLFLGSAYNEADYPSVEAVADKFAYRTSFSPLPMGRDFRCDIGAAEATKIQEQINRDSTQAMEAAVASLYSRMAEVVQPLVERLGKADNVFRDTLVENVRDLVAVLPKLNVTDNPEIEAMTKRLRRSLCTVEPDQLRNNHSLRTQVHDEAVKLSGDLSDYLNGGL